MAQPQRNLLIVHTPHAEDILDWLEVKRRIEKRAPDIEVRVATNGAANSVTRRWQVTRPSLVLSASRLQVFRPKGGKVYAAHRIPKLEQIERLASQGLPVPRTAVLERGIALDPTLWGRYVVAKPLELSSGGENVRLVPTDAVAGRYTELTQDGARGMLIQPHIEHSEDGFPTEYRVLTMLGKVLYSARNRWGKARAPLERIADDPLGIIASNDKSFGRIRQVCNDPEIIALGERAHSAFADLPVLGVDVLRETGTGKLYVMEVNPGGSTWHFSSMLARTTFTAEHVRDLYAQFDALDRVAQLLVDRTRAEAG